jgi:hypothetical protein
MEFNLDIKKWLYSCPDLNNWFGVYICKIYQSLFPCKHHWHEYKGGFRRKCTKCWKHQYKFYSRYGDIRIGWKDLPVNITEKDSILNDYN